MTTALMTTLNLHLPRLFLAVPPKEQRFPFEEEEEEWKHYTNRDIYNEKKYYGVWRLGSKQKWRCWRSSQETWWQFGEDHGESFYRERVHR
jgi:hypothetical protein